MTLRLDTKKLWHRLGRRARRLLAYSRRRRSRLIPKNYARKIQVDWPKSRVLLERILEKNILPFWYPMALDRENGGYRLNPDVDGVRKRSSNKSLVSQARILWFFSRLSGTQYGKPEHLEAAQHGFSFLREHLWDKDSAGFFCEVDSTGKSATITEKHLYGQAFALYAISEYALVSGDSSVDRFAREVFDLLETHAHDAQFGGYHEFFLRDWSQPPPDRKGYLGAKPGIKLMNTHLHLMESIETFHALTGAPIAKERLMELISILSNAVVRKTVGACTDRFHSDWTPVSGWNYERVSYGHDLENIWLLMKACEAVDLQKSPFLDLFRTLFNYTLKYGFDHRKGGVYHTGYFYTPADNRNKVAWVQAEVLIASLRMYRLTQEEIYSRCFHPTLDWINKYQVDWETGEWYVEVLKNGMRVKSNAEPWKSPYHNGRAMLECLEIIDNMSDRSPV